MKLIFASVAAAAIVIAAPAKADTYVATFSGHVTQINGASTIFGAVGDTANISVTYDDSSPLSNFGHSGNTTYYNFFAVPGSWTFQVGPTGGTAGDLSFSLNYTSFCGFFSCSSSSAFGGNADFNAGNFWGNMGFGLGFNPSLGLGNSLADASSVLATGPVFTSNSNMTFSFNNGTASETLNTNIESYSVTGGVAPVPAPIVGAGLPGLVSLLGGGWWLRRRRQAAVTA